MEYLYEDWYEQISYLDRFMKPSYLEENSPDKLYTSPYPIEV